MEAIRFPHIADDEQARTIGECLSDHGFHKLTQYREHLAAMYNERMFDDKTAEEIERQITFVDLIRTHFLKFNHDRLGDETQDFSNLYRLRPDR